MNSGGAAVPLAVPIGLQDVISCIIFYVTSLLYALLFISSGDIYMRGLRTSECNQATGSNSLPFVWIPNFI